MSHRTMQPGWSFHTALNGLASRLTRGMVLAVCLVALGTGKAAAADFAANFGHAGSGVIATSTAVDGAGNTYLGGRFSGAAVFGSVTLTAIGSVDVFAAKLDASGSVVWAKNFGGSGADAYGSGIAADASGNVYLGGNFQFANLTTPALTRIGIYDAFAVKLDSSGTTIWAKNFGGSGAGAVVRGVAADASGNVYLGGNFFTANLTTPALTKIGTQDPFAIKLDSSGTTIWAKNFGGSGAAANVRCVAVDASGNVYLGGHFNGNNLTTPALTRIGNVDAFAVKLDSSGTTIWAKNFGGSGASAYGSGIAADASGNVYLGGDFDVNNLTTPALTRIGNVDAFAVKLDSSGTTIWAKNFGGSGVHAYGSGIAADASGNVYLGGYFDGNNLTTPALTKIGSFDAFAVKLDSSGTTTWAKNFGGSGASARSSGIAADASGNVYLGGHFNGNNLTTPALTKIGSFDALIIKRLTSPSGPGAPSAVTAFAGNAQAKAAFTAPAGNGGGPITGYTVVSSPAGGVDSNAGSTALSHLVTGLANGTPYTFTVTARNAVGTGAPSAPSNSVTPRAVILSAAAAPAQPLTGQPVTLTAFVVARNYAGVVAFNENGAALPGCAAVTVAPLPGTNDTGIATCTITAIAAGNHNYVVRAPHSTDTGFEQVFVSVSAVNGTGAATASANDYSDMWWAGEAENGWGVSIAQHGNIQFIVLYVYDAAGRPIFYVMPGGSWNATATAYTGMLYQPTSSPFSVYDAAQFKPGGSGSVNSPVGTATVTYTGNSTATLTYTINGVSGSKAIRHQMYAADDGLPRLNVKDMWWGGQEQNGWGINIAQQGRVLFPVWYSYGADGKATFFAVPGGSWSGNTFTGDIYTTISSPWLGVPYSASLFSVTKVGVMNLEFVDQANALMTYTVNGLTQTKAIVRQPY